MMGLHFPILSLAIRKFAKSKIQHYWPEFKGRRGWLQKFTQRHGLALQRRTSISQKLTKQLEEKLSALFVMCAKFLKIGKYPLVLVGNMDETPGFFNMVLNKSFAKKISKSVTVRTFGCQKKRVAVVLTIAACEDILPPMIIFAGKNDRFIKDLTVTDDLCIVNQEKVWRGERLMIG